jgi:hypothetical protein
VRPDSARLQNARVVAEEFDRPLAALRVFQWPETQKNWIAQPAPAGVKFEGELVSIVVQPLIAFDPGAVTAALLIDEWQEVIPTSKETTAISFHYDAPNAEPPQTLLLAVSQRSPNNNLRWTWDELVACVEQALRVAKMRAVGPDELRQTKLDAVLPATLLAEAAGAATISTSLLANISDVIAKADFEVWRQT